MKNIIKITIFVMGLGWGNCQLKAEAITVAHSFLSHSNNIAIMENQAEIWKDIPNYEGLYQVSNLGNVKSLDRYVKNRWKYRLVKQKILSSSSKIDGYLSVGLYKNSTGKTLQIHQLVAIAFLNHKPNGHKLVVNHINFNKHDNRVENLEIITHRENSNLKHIIHSSIYTGVFWHKNDKKWTSRISINGKSRYLGNFNNEYDAHLCYENALKQEV